ncbi:MAG: replicative DNA helicase [Clostridia bacterium]|nr:replicative DNA helicase [Clostridia bacterium]
MNDNMSRRAPFSREAEMSVLGAILIKPESMDKVTGIISSGDFYMTENQTIFSAMQEMYLESRDIDVVTLIDKLAKSGKFDDAGGREYIRVISETVPTAANVTDYAKIVKDKSILRTLIDACETTAEEAYADSIDAQELLEAAEQRIYSIADENENREFVHIKEALMQSFNRLQELKDNRAEAIGMPTGFSGIDRVLVGMGKGDLIIVGARPGMGKTSFVMNVAVNTALRSDKAVCIFSLEMSTEQLATRLLSGEAFVDSIKLRSGLIDEEDWEKLAHASARLAGCNILINDRSAMTVSGMKSQLRRVKNLGLVIIDYLGLVKNETRIDNKAQAIEEITNNLKRMAKEFGVPVITCAQLNRSTEKRTDNRPTLSDLRDSGGIEQDADVVMFIYRPGEYDKEDPQKQTQAEVIIAKNRHGSQDIIKMNWLKNFTKFVTLEEDRLPDPGH